MHQVLWRPNEETIKQANMNRYLDFLKRRYGINCASYRDLYDWSVTKIPAFWSSVWEFVEIRASKKYDTVVEDLGVFPGTRWFPGAKLNFAENLLRYRDEHTAFIFKGETQKSATLSYAELYDT